MIRDHDDRKGTFAGPRSFICWTSARIGLLHITACCTEVCSEPIEIAESAFIARLERVPDGTRGA